MKTVEHQIELIAHDIRAVHGALYCKDLAVTQFDANKIQKLLLKEIIERAQTECTSPIVFEYEQDDSLRFLLDYHKLNAVIVRDSNPL